jgi:cysteinyl-tRNA synthetase
MLRFRNTLSGEVEQFVPLEEGRVRIYACGPTVYNFAHIGNFRTFVFYDIVHRYMKYRGYDVTLVMNLTDVDDKTIKGALERGMSLDDFTARYIEAFLEDLDALNIEMPAVMPRATEHIEEMVALVEALERGGYAYRADDSVYYRVSAFDGYGKLSGAKVAGNVAGAGGRVDAAEYEKADARDFVLWKAPKLEDEPSWDTRVGVGRPGWHLECSAMSMKYLGETFDMHLGGTDLVFPHHENEIAQSEAATGKPFVRYWLHSEFLNVDNEKMAKSTGNIYTLRDLLAEGFQPMAIRYLLLSAPYRTQLNFTFDGLKAAVASLDRLRNFRRRLVEAQTAEGGEGEGAAAARRALEAFEAAMDDDLNTSGGLAAVFNLVSDVNPLIDAKRITESDRAAIVSALERVDSVLGVLSAHEDDAIPEEVLSLVEQRTAARLDRDFKRADELREAVTALGYVIEDSPEGPKVRRK